MEWGPVLVASVGVGLLLIGAHGFYLRGQFGFMDALYCGLLLIPAAVLLLVTSYVLQHAKLVALIPLLFAGLLVHAYPSFAVALGVALAGVVLGPALREWNDARHQRGSTPGIDP
jgi:hypothetical protein